MVGNFVRLKLRVLANRLRTQSVIGTLGYVAVWIVGVIGGILGGVLVFGLGRLSGEPGLILMLGYSAVFIGWMVVPALMSALDETLDPRRFELLPISPRRLTAGLLAAGAVSPGGLGTLIGLVIATFGLFPRVSLWPIALVAVVAQLMLCLVVARFVTSFLSNLLASRRMRDMATVLFAVVIALVASLPAIFRDTDREATPDIEITVTSLAWIESLVWLPSGALAASVDRWADGGYGAAAAFVAFGLAATALIGWLWARSVRRMLTTAPSSGGRARSRGELDRTLAIAPSWFGAIASGAVAGAMAKELRYLMRDNRVRAQLIGSVIPVVVIGVVFFRGLAASEYAPFLAAGIAVLFVLGILLNQFGIDGGSFWAYVVSPAPLSATIRGRNLLWGVVTAPLIVVGAVALALLSQSFSYLVAAILASIAVLLVTMGLGNLTSIYGAYPISERNPFGSQGTGSGTAFVATVVAMLASGVLLLPPAAMVGLPAIYMGPLEATVGSALAIGYGIVVHRVSMKLASRLLLEREHILLDLIDREFASN